MGEKRYTKRDLAKAKKAADLARKLALMIEEQIQERELRPKLEAMVGDCFRYRNSYSCPQKPEDCWWLYVRVVGVDGASLKTIQVQRDKYGVVDFKEGSVWCHTGNLGPEYLPIHPHHFNKMTGQILAECAVKLTDANMARAALTRARGAKG